MAGIYQIRLKGHLDPRHAEWFDGFTMTLRPNGETMLIGKVVDQAALYGLLIRIRDLGIPLLSVNEIGNSAVATTKTNPKVES